jgi:EAL domain-containing protein (putative c-di-GMP-specific phosphodiesterase class I)
MPAAPKPFDEDDRLTAVIASGLLERRTNPRLQVLTELAADLLGRPNAGLSIIESDRQVFRTRCGFTPRSTSRDVSFCAHAILTPDRPFIIADARIDPRFADNLLVTGEPGIRSYAGVAVRSSGGQPIGALCVLDREPGGFTAQQIDTLSNLARKVENVIERSRPALGKRGMLLHELRQAIIGRALGVAWQPLADAATLQVKDYEALVRWTRHTGEKVSPDQFIPIAEASNLIFKIDQLVLEMACEQAADGKIPNHLSVNVSSRWFHPSRPSLAAAIASALSRTGLSPERLTIEITERVLINDPDFASSKLAKLKSLGIRLALDDFGTGYSSLSYLKRYPFDVIKLDKSFVCELGTDERADAVARAVIRLGKDLGMEICAEGVEEHQQLEFLRQAGCDLVQGHLIGRPGPAPVVAWPSAR